MIHEQESTISVLNDVWTYLYQYFMKIELKSISSVCLCMCACMCVVNIVTKYSRTSELLNPRITNNTVNQTAMNVQRVKYCHTSSSKYLTVLVHTHEIAATTTSALSFAWYFLLPSSSKDSNVSELCREAEVFEESGPRLYFVSRNQGVYYWQNNCDRY